MPVQDPSDDYELFTSFRYDPKLLTAPYNTEVNGIELPYLFFAYHVDRLISAATAFGWPRAVQAVKAYGAADSLRHMCDQAVMDCVLPDKERGLGLRVLLAPSGDLRVEAHPIRQLSDDLLRAAHFNPPSTLVDTAAAAAAVSDAPSPIFAVYIDTKPTPSSPFTSYKTTLRAHYDAARLRRGIRDRREAREVVLVNERGELTEGSVRNVALWRDGAWVTPPARSGGLPGTVRRYLLERGLIREGIVRAADVRPGDWVLLSNAWDGTLLGRISKD